MLNLLVNLDIYTRLLLLLALAFVLFYKAVSGFHNTVNAVTTVIYTRAMQSQLVAVMAAFFSFFGVLFGGLNIVYAIVHMLPTDLLLSMGSTHGLAMVFSILLTTIIWNLGTWFFGLPASSSHTLIGAIIDTGLTNALLNGSSVTDALNLREIARIFSSLTISPIMGLVIAGGLIFLLRRFWSGMKKRDRIHRIPGDRKKKEGKCKPPFWTRIALIVSAASVALLHSANDGQKGIGLVMLVLVGITPTGFVINMNTPGYEITRTHDAITSFERYLQQHPELPQKLIAMEPPLPMTSTGDTQVAKSHYHPTDTSDAIARAKTILPGNMENYEPLSVSWRGQLRRIMLCTSDTSMKLAKLPGVSKGNQNLLKKLYNDMLSTIEYVLVWIIMAVALALGIGTTTSWRRVAMTIGEKVGKRGMTRAQGTAAQMVAAMSIGLVSCIGMPVSTTHILSSAVAGTMMVDSGGLQRKTATSILMAWVSTLPAAIFLSDGLYWIAL